MKKIVFIVNPKAGVTPKNKPLMELITENMFSSSKFITELHFTEFVGHATILAEQAVLDHSDIVVAAGGDGTINEVAKVLVGTDAALGILPSGSGNGLAKSLGIYMSHTLALRTISKAKIRPIDVGYANDIFFASIAGVGFDAYVAQKFVGSQLRGLLSYMNIIMQEFPSYKPNTYKLNIDGKIIEREAFMIVVANSDQFGFNTRIAPEALPDDGLFDVCVINKMPTVELLPTLFHLMKGTLNQSKYVEYLKAKNISITNESIQVMNIDGEAQKIVSPINICLRPLSLNVIVP